MGWKPTDADRDASWVFYSELTTRVTHEPLRYRSGDEAAALSSLHKLFKITRNLLNSHDRTACGFGLLARIVLNEDIRPFTARWHRRMLIGLLNRQDHKRIFRRELFDLQVTLKKRTLVFGRMAECVAAADEGLSATTEPRVKFDGGRVWPSSANTKSGRGLPPPRMLEHELSRIAKRRQAAYGYEQEKRCGGLSKDKDGAEAMGIVGLAISGGGIRSATFALGVLQVLAKRGILRDVDYLSTVSGGGYIGSFLSSHLRAWDDAPLERLLVPPPTEVETKQVRWLRNQSKALQPKRWIEFLGILRTLLFSPFLILAAFSGILIVSMFKFGWLVGCVGLGTLAALVVLEWVVFRFSGYRLFDPNRASFHHFYRRRLAETYIKPLGKDGGRAPRLSELSTQKGAPYQLINTTVHLPASENPELRGRRSDFFLFSEGYSGSVLTEYCRTGKLEERDPRLDLATVMAISGAAISTHMGTLKRRRLARPLLALARLGYWAPNPRHAMDSGIKARRPGLGELVRESFGSFGEGNAYVNLSDGGHIENMGIYELLRRRCKVILCIDGEQDKRQGCAGLIKVRRFAWIDMGIDLEIELEELEVGEDGLSQTHFALGTINYGVSANGDRDIGYLIYIKLSMTGNEKDYIHEYRRRHPAFPHQSTIDQLFDEDQFEAYRALGEHAGEDLFDSDLVPCDLPQQYKTGAWIRALVEAIEPKPPQSFAGS